MAKRIGQTWEPRDDEAINEGLIKSTSFFLVTGQPTQFNSTPHLQTPTWVEVHPIIHDDGTPGTVSEVRWDELYRRLD